MQMSPSGTKLTRRDEFHRMLQDCRLGKIDLILTKSVTRFAKKHRRQHQSYPPAKRAWHRRIF
ncbi:MAG: recombinase family protein [Enterocloster clostridioformis]